MEELKGYEYCADIVYSSEDEIGNEITDFMAKLSPFLFEGEKLEDNSGLAKYRYFFNSISDLMETMKTKPKNIGLSEMYRCREKEMPGKFFSFDGYNFEYTISTPKAEFPSEATEKQMVAECFFSRKNPHQKMYLQMLPEYERLLVVEIS